MKVGDRVKFKYGWKETREGVLTAKLIVTESNVENWIGNEVFTICGDDKCVDYIPISDILDVIK